MCAPSPRSWRGAATACSSWRRRRRPRSSATGASSPARAAERCSSVPRASRSWSPSARRCRAPGAAGRRSRSTSRARSSDLFERTPLDICHVHEPFAPSIAEAALRVSRALNVGSFHAPTERIVATQVARKVVQLVFGRLDARSASFAATAALMERHFPGELRGRRARRARGGARAAPGRGAGPRSPSARTRSVPRCACCSARCARSTPRRHGSSSYGRRAARRPLRCAPTCATACATSTPRDAFEELLAGSACSSRRRPAPSPGPRFCARRCAGAVPVASRLPVYEEVLRDGERGLLFEPRDADVLAAQLSRLIDDPGLRARLRRAAGSRGRGAP